MISLDFKGWNKGTVFVLTFILLATFLLAFVTPVSATPKPIYGYAEKDGSPADDAMVTVTSSYGSVSTTVGPAGGWSSGYWQVDVGEYSVDTTWADGTSFDVIITDGDWRASASGIVSGNYTEIENITLENQGSSGEGGGGAPGPSNNPPTADADGPYNGYSNNSIIFDGSASNDTDGTISNYSWDFGDDFTGYGVTSIHIYENTGNYTVTLTVMDNDGATDSDTTSATISTEPTGEKPVAVFTAPAEAVTNEPVSFFGSGSYDSDGTIVNYTWAFDDGTMAYVENPTHVFLVPNTYVVELLVTDNDGKTDTAEKIISVYAGELIDINNGYIVDENNDGESDAFFNMSTGEMTGMQKQADGTFLIDSNNDGIWDHVYNPSNGMVTSYEEPKEDEGFPWLIVAVIIIVIILIIIGILFYTGILYIEK